MAYHNSAKRYRVSPKRKLINYEIHDLVIIFCLTFDCRHGDQSPDFLQTKNNQRKSSFLYNPAKSINLNDCRLFLQRELYKALAVMGWCTRARARIIRCMYVCNEIYSRCRGADFWRESSLRREQYNKKPTIRWD